MILAIDPGTTESGWVIYADGRVQQSGVDENAAILERIAESNLCTDLCIEMVASYGMPVGREVFETVRWIGRMAQCWRDPEAVRYVYRREVKSHLCGSMKAKDGNVRQALIDKLGAPGTKAAPGATYGVRSHAWAALAVAVTAAETPG